MKPFRDSEVLLVIESLCRMSGLKMTIEQIYKGLTNGKDEPMSAEAEALIEGSISRMMGCSLEIRDHKGNGELNISTHLLPAEMYTFKIHGKAVHQLRLLRPLSISAAVEASERVHDAARTLYGVID